MKRKIIAAALALCLVLGLLPMSALAATYKLTLADSTEVGTLETNDVTGAYEETALTGALAHYSVAAGTITVGNKTAQLTAHYGEAPGTISVTATLVDEDTFTAIEVTFEAGEGTGTMAKVTVGTEALAAAWTLPQCSFTAPSEKVFAGWKLSTDEASEPTLYAEGAEYPLTENVTFVATWKDAELKIQDNQLVVAGEDALEDAAGTYVAVPVTEEEVRFSIPEATVSALEGTNGIKLEATKAGGNVEIPLDALVPDMTVTIAKSTKTGSAVAGGIQVTLSNAPAAGAKPSEQPPLKTPLRITLTVTTMPSNAVFAYVDGNGYRRARTNGNTILTRHTTEFVVLDGDQLAAGDVQADYLPVLTDNVTNAVEFLTEVNDYYCIVYEKADGTYATVSRKAPNLDEDYGMAYEAVGEAAGTTLISISTSDERVELDGQYGLQFNTEFASAALN